MSSRCGWKEVYNYIDFLILLIPTPLVPVLFFAASLLFVKCFNVFRSCSSTFFVIYLIIFSRSINNHTGDYERPTKPYEGLHIMFYTRRSTHKRTLHILQWTPAV